MQSKSLFKDASSNDKIFNYNISVSDQENDQMIKISPRTLFLKNDKKFIVHTDFYFLVPYGQDLVDFKAISETLVLESFKLQRTLLLSSNLPYLVAPDIPQDFDKLS